MNDCDTDDYPVEHDFVIDDDYVMENDYFDDAEEGLFDDTEL